MSQVSPEERLFEIIRDGKDVAGAGSDAGIAGAGAKVRLAIWRRILFRLNPFRAFGALGAAPEDETSRRGGPLGDRREGRLSLAMSLKLQEMDFFRKALAHGLRPQAINRALAGLLVIAAWFVVYQGIVGRPDISRVTQAISGIEYRPPRRKAMEGFKPADFYLEEERKRNIFRPSPRPEDKVAISQPKENKPQARLEDLAGSLKLVGISWGASPKAMIKDASQGVTYFLRQGEMVGTSGIKVKTIFKDKVVLSYEEQEMELL